jgi:four helix bundle protein
MSMTFEDLDAWKKARATVNAVYAMTRNASLARDFGLSSQVQRAAVSVMSNIAEGFERHNAGEKIQAYNIARASWGEVRSLLYVIEDNYSLGTAVADARQNLADTGSLLSGLIFSTRKRLAVKVAGGVTSVAIITLPGIHFLTQIF